MRECKFKEKINAYLDGELEKAEFTEVKAHLASCLSCQQEIREINKVNAALAEYSDEDVPEHIIENILNAVHPVSEKKTRKRQFNLSVAASIVFALVSGVLMSNFAFKEQPAEQNNIEFAQESFYSFFDSEEL